MGRKSSPNYWTREKAWFTRINGQLIRLSQPGPKEATRAEAERKFRRLISDADRSDIIRPIKVPLACDKFLAHSKLAHTAGTFEQYQIKLQDFAAKFRSRCVHELRPSDITVWLADHPDWSQGTQRGAITAVKVMCSWLVKERLLDSSPIESVKRPPMPKRKAYIPPETRDQILESVTEPFRSFVMVLMEIGCRPGELMALEARHIDWTKRIAQLPCKTTRATGEIRTLYLTEAALAICRTMADKHPQGPIFLNSRGKPWDRNAVRCRMRRLPVKATAYGFRHSFVTDALAHPGVSPASVAAMVGHRDLKTTAGYSHIADQQTRLQKVAEDLSQLDVD